MKLPPADVKTFYEIHFYGGYGAQGLGNGVRDTGDTAGVMMKIIRNLTVTKLEIRHRFEGKYVLTLSEPSTWPEAESTLTLRVEDAIRFGLDPAEELVGTEVELTLQALPYDREAPSPDTVIITGLTASREVSHHYTWIPPDKSVRCTFRLSLKTPVMGGTLVVLPSTYYELNLSLSPEEYRRVRRLPANTAFQVSLRPASRRFKDIVLTCRATLDDPRVFPPDYAARMIPLARAMIEHLGGDVDVVEHYCGLEIEVETENRPDVRTWQREYFAVDPLSPRDWESPFEESVARIDAILKERYDNRLPCEIREISQGLPMSSVHHFYDHLKTSIWESGEPGPVQELTVGLEARYCFREGIHLPDIIVEARSVDGNRKACEDACRALSERAASLFEVEFKRWSLEMEGFG